MIRFLKLVIPLLLLAIGASVAFQILSANKPEPETSSEPPKSLSVFSERIENRDLSYKINAQGEVRPRSEIGLTPQVSGRISFLSDRFVDGGYIAKDEIIARLDPMDFELAVIRAQAIVASAEQQLTREHAEAEIAIRDLDDLGISESSPLARREPQMAEAQASLNSAQAQLQEAELALDRSIIRAPFNLRVRSRSADIGQFVSPGQSLGNVFATDAVEISLPITDAQLGQLGLPLAFSHGSRTPGPEVKFNANVGGEMRTWTGRIVRTSAAINSQSRLINIVGEVKDPYGRGADNGAPIAPGLFVTATISGRTVENVLWAPRAALRGDDKLFIPVEPEQKSTTDLLIDGANRTLAGFFGGPPPLFNNFHSTKALSIRKVDVLHTDESGVYFTGGADAGELAIVSPIQAAFDGMRLNIKERLSDGTILDEDAEEAFAASGPVETVQ